MIDWNYIDKLYKDITKKKVSAVEFLQNNLDNLVFLEQDEDMSFIHIGDYTHGMFLYMVYKGGYYIRKVFRYCPSTLNLPNSIMMSIWYCDHQESLVYEPLKVPNLYDHMYSKWTYVVTEKLTNKNFDMWEWERNQHRHHEKAVGIINGIDNKLYICRKHMDFGTWAAFLSVEYDVDFDIDRYVFINKKHEQIRGMIVDL